MKQDITRSRIPSQEPIPQYRDQKGTTSMFERTVDIIDYILESLYVFVIRLGICLLVWMTAPTWISVLLLLAVILIPILNAEIPEFDFAVDAVLLISLAIISGPALVWYQTLLLVVFVALLLGWQKYIF